MNEKPITPRKPLRLWPGVLAGLLLLVCRFGLRAMGYGFTMAVQGGFVGAGLVLIWWLLLSRTAWRERLGFFALMAGSLGAAWLLKHESMGPFWLFVYAIPILFLAFVVGAAA